MAPFQPFYAAGFLLFGVVALLNLVVACKESYSSLQHVYHHLSG